MRPRLSAKGAAVDWFRMQHKVAHDAKIQTLPIDLRWRWVECLCLASENDQRGTLPPVRQVAFTMRVTEAEATEVLERLVAAGLLDRSRSGGFHPHDWDDYQMESDSSAERTRRYRERKKKAEKNGRDVEQLSHMKGHETSQKRHGDVDTKRHRDVTVTPQIRLEERREESSLSNDNDDNSRAGDADVVADGNTNDATTDTGEADDGPVVVAPEHAAIVADVRAAFGDRAADAVAEMGRDIDGSLGGRWDCYRAAVRAAARTSRSGRRIDNLHGYCIRTAQRYTVTGIPPEPVAVEARASPQRGVEPIVAKLGGTLAEMKARGRAAENERARLREAGP